ncbi:hypothetical protein Dsin_024953 [Dipteronia sinensis]|uniref:DUF4283 domain-containing protein n=1 Tax=Dipteronia sinensis TaxID=43782 RepID=A0AAD9ZWC1_9ROSI|nr:hypothetical protein Dsin_024953 [Dipteronia sinensis]
MYYMKSSIMFYMKSPPVQHEIFRVSLFIRERSSPFFGNRRSGYEEDDIGHVEKWHVRGRKDFKESLFSIFIDNLNPKVYVACSWGVFKVFGRARDIFLFSKNSSRKRVLKAFSFISKVNRRLISWDFSFSSLYVSDESILWCFESEIEKEDFIRNRFFGEDCFTSMFSWSDAKLFKGKLAWINVVGVPMTCWEEFFFQKLGRHVGKPLWMDKETSSRGRLDRGKLLAMVPLDGQSFHNINVSMEEGCFMIGDVEKGKSLWVRTPKARVLPLYYQNTKLTIGKMEDQLVVAGDPSFTDSDTSSGAFSNFSGWEGCIILAGELVKLGKEVASCNVYALNVESAIVELWEFILRAQRSFSMPWCIGGDFNTVLCVAERKVVDIPIHEISFTWSNNREQAVWARLERFLISPWILFWSPKMTQIGLPMSILDHIDVLIGYSKDNLGLSPFRFYNDWLEDDELMSQAKEGWVGCKVTELWKGIRKEEQMWRKKSRVKWLKEGDKNSKYFYCLANIRRINNQIGEITIDGATISGPILVKEEIDDFFENHFKKVLSNTPIVQGFSLRQLSVDERVSLDNRVQNYPWIQISVRIRSI